MSDDFHLQAHQPKPQCSDPICHVRRDCPLYLPGRLIRETLRQLWESERIPCMARLRFEGGEPPKS
jgi:hypothetical protein